MEPTQVVALDVAEAEVAKVRVELTAALKEVSSLEQEVARLEEENAKLKAIIAGQKPQGLLFWSRFGPGVTLGPVRDLYENGGWQDIFGLDQETGFAWPPEIAAPIAGASPGFQVRAGDHPTEGVYTPALLSEFIVNELPVVVGRDGRQKRVQRTLIKKNPVTGLGSQGNLAEQCPYIFAPKNPRADMYISFWRKLQPDLVQKLVNGWHMLFEWKTSGDYRISTQVVTYSGKPAWMCRADNVAGGNPNYEEYWRVNPSLRVPIGEWFKYEVFWHLSKGSDGRVWMAVNGQVLADKFGPNIGVNNNAIDRIMPMQLYSSATYPLEQWTDDLQIWSTFPVAKQGDPWYDGVYAPH